ncbi:MAG TPA: ABC transporter substrate-binding protein [Burkholderiaceae bacterium]|nr:ABC transporter substrate-binding protein [Burkholderiaceae bacterium]
MSTFSTRAKCIAAVALNLLLLTTGSAQIRIGQTTGITGPVAAPVKEINIGAMLYLDYVNAQGGVAGQQIELVTLDDKNQAPISAENAKKLVADPHVVALFLNRGTPHAQAMLPVLEEARIVLLAPSTGAMVLHKPVHPYVFNVRATYQKEAERLTRHFGMAGLDRVGICYVDDSFGTDALQGALNVYKSADAQPALNEKIDKFKPDYSKCVEKTLATKPLGLIIIGTTVSVATGVKALRDAGSRVTIGTLSNNAAKGFVDALGEYKAGVIVSQVFPSERRLAVPMIAEAARLASTKNIQTLTPAMVEGYAAAKTLVVALKRAAKDKDGITRASVKRTLDSFGEVDLGGIDLTYSPTDHSGLEYVDLSFISEDGSFRR